LSRVSRVRVSRVRVSRVRVSRVRVSRVRVSRVRVRGASFLSSGGDLDKKWAGKKKERGSWT